jgi:hypothetical protein
LPLSNDKISGRSYQGEENKSTIFGHRDAGHSRCSKDCRGGPLVNAFRVFPCTRPENSGVVPNQSPVWREIRGELYTTVRAIPVGFSIAFQYSESRRKNGTRCLGKLSTQTKILSCKQLNALARAVQCTRCSVAPPARQKNCVLRNDLTIPSSPRSYTLPDA